MGGLWYHRDGCDPRPFVAGCPRLQWCLCISGYRRLLPGTLRQRNVRQECVLDLRFWTKTLRTSYAARNYFCFYFLHVHLYGCRINEYLERIFGVDQQLQQGFYNRYYVRDWYLHPFVHGNCRIALLDRHRSIPGIDHGFLCNHPDRCGLCIRRKPGRTRRIQAGIFVDRRGVDGDGHFIHCHFVCRTFQPSDLAACMGRRERPGHEKGICAW
mmetsp:Transcript_7564/g.14954  ORF Transcript_7564/g.14954 Transcript_7564/m.14954 type:complete len:213 (+) Transcript_7564:477-1115(+)